MTDRARARVLVRAVGMTLVACATVHAATIVATSEQVRAFVGNRAARIVCVDGGLVMVDFAPGVAASPVTIASGTIGERPRLSFDGACVTYSSGGRVWAQAARAGAERFEIGAGEHSFWWVHPVSRRTYILWAKGEAKSNAGIFIREVDGAGKPVAAEALFSTEEMAYGGRSADGRFVGAVNQRPNPTIEGVLDGHGLYEIQQPWDAVANAATKCHHFAGGAFCNGSLCSSGPSGAYYGCLAHLDEGHVYFNVRRYRSDAAGIRTIITDYVAHVGLTSTVFPGRTEWHAPSWSTDDRFITVTTLRDRSDKGNDNVCIFDLTKFLGDTAHPRQAFLEVTRGGGQFPHMWIENSDGLRASSSPAAPARPNPRVVQLMAGGGVRVDLAGDWRLTLFDGKGRSLSARNGRGPGVVWLAAQGAIGSRAYILTSGDGLRIAGIVAPVR